MSCLKVLFYILILYHTVHKPPNLYSIFVNQVQTYLICWPSYICTVLLHNWTTGISGFFSWYSPFINIFKHFREIFLWYIYAKFWSKYAISFFINVKNISKWWRKYFCCTSLAGANRDPTGNYRSCPRLGSYSSNYVIRTQGLNDRGFSRDRAFRRRWQMTSNLHRWKMTSNLHGWQLTSKWMKEKLKFKN